MLILILLIGQIRVYFQPDSIHKRLIARIDSAQYSIDACFYKIHDGPGLPPSPGTQVIDALLSAWQRNVKIRVITDDENLSYLNRIRQVGIPVMSDSGLRGQSYTMHNKFAIFDYRDTSPETPAWVWTGSYNPSEDLHADNAIEIQSESLAYLYTLEFNQMWGGDVDTIIRDTSLTRFHRRKSNVLPYRSVPLGPYEIRPFFSPQDSALDTVLREVAQTDSSISFCLYAFSVTYPKGKYLADTIIRHWRENKEVGGVFCGSLANAAWSAYPYLRDSGLMVYRDRVVFGDSLLHHKFAVLDKKKIITGSMNWSEAGNRESDENTLIISGPLRNPLALAYDSEFVRRFQEAGYDVGVYKICSPKGEIDSGLPITPSCSVYNRGIKDTSYWVRIKVGDSYNRLSYVSNHPARTYLYLQFPPDSNFPRGRYSVSCSTRLGIDTDRSNDKKIDSFSIRVRDVGVTQLLLPETIDSLSEITPACSVHNYGTTIETYPVRLKIGDFYNEVATVSNHSPGQTLHLTFPSYTHWRRGNWIASCSTELNQDLVVVNDKDTSSIFVRVFDVQTIQINSPTGIVDLGEVYPVQARIKNNGNTNVSFDVKFEITDGYSDTKSVSDLAPGTEIDLDFADWQANSPGSFTTKCSTRLTNDMITTNDKSTGSVFVQYLDAQCLSIDEPIGTVNYGEIIYPKATVRNNSNTEKTFDVTFWIEGSKYEDTRSITLGPNEEEQLTFAEWVAEPIGSLGIRCTTKLDGDLNNANDQQEGEVFVRFLDVGVIEIIAPTDTVDSGAIILPQAKVKNFGNTTVTFDATFFIEGVKWSSTKPVIDLTPNEERVIEFDYWIADSVGSFTTKCTIQLSGDMNNTNDKEEGQVFVKGGISYGGWFKVGEVPLEPDRKRIKSGGGITRCGDKLYILKGNNTRSLYWYIPNEPTAAFEETIPFGFGKKVKKGGAITSDGNRFLYLTKGANTREFWRYDTQNKVWDSLPLVPIGAGKNLKGGTGMAYLNGFVYLLKGSKTNEFYAFDCANNTWIETLPPALEGNYPGKGYGDGSCLIAYDDNTLYALRGKYNELYKYDISAHTWEKDSSMPFTHPMWNKKKKVGEGAGMTLKNGKIYAFKGNNTKEFWSFDPTTKWAGLETIPKLPDKKYVKGGGGLCIWTDGTIYALKGNNTTSIWKYTSEYLPLVISSSNIGTRELTRKTFVQINSNPTKGLTKVYYNLPKREVAVLKIYNTLGNLVYSAKSDKGKFTIKKLPAGIYLLRFESASGGYKEEKKLIVVK